MAEAVNEAIFAALMSRVSGLSAPSSLGLPVAYPEKPFTPPADGKYLRVWLHSDGVVTALTRVERHTGALQVDVVWPRGAGLAAVMAAVDAVTAHFARPLALMRSGFAIRIVRPPQAGPLLDEGGAIFIPVRVAWFCDHLRTD